MNFSGLYFIFFFSLFSVIKLFVFLSLITILSQLKKQVISLFLLFLLIAPAAVTYTWLQKRKQAVKKEVKWKMISGIDKNELVFLKFSKKEITSKLRWVHSKEFEYNHQMYDVVEKKTIKDSVYLRCWWDHKETKLNKQLDSLLVNVFQNDSKTKEKQEKVFSFYKLLYYQPVFSWQPLTGLVFFKEIVSKKKFYKSLPALILLQPPKF